MISDHSCVCCVYLPFFKPLTDELKLCLPLEHVSLWFHSLSTLFFQSFFIFIFSHHLSTACFQEAPSISYSTKTQTYMLIIGEGTCHSGAASLPITSYSFGCGQKGLAIEVLTLLQLILQGQGQFIQLEVFVFSLYLIINKMTEHYGLSCRVGGNRKQRNAFRMSTRWNMLQVAVVNMLKCTKTLKLR